MNLNTLVCKNQSIKIIPPIEDSLRNLGFDVDLNENAIAWLNHLKTTWKTWKNSVTVENHVESFFILADKPFHLALAMIIKCDEFKDSKPKSLPYFIVEILDKWSAKHKKTPSNDVKLPAFQIAIHQRNHCFQTLVIKTYKICTMNNEILPTVKEMIRNGNHKQAASIVIATELFNEIPVEDLLFPLILQDKTNIVDDYLIQCPSQVIPFLLFLDKLLDKNFDIQEFIQSYLNDQKITDVKYEKMHYKPLGKLVARLCNKFKIPINKCKNLSKNRTTGGLRYLIFQKYQERNVSLTVWDDLVKDALAQNSDSAMEFIDRLADYDKKEALKWAEYLKIPVSSYPAILKEPIQNNIDSTEKWDEEPSTSQTYYKIPFCGNQIKIVDNTEKFYDMITTDLSSCTVIGIDCEWKPTFGTSQTQVALMQISTTNMVYLIDTLLLNKKEFVSFWYMFNKSLLDNAEIIKIGFGLEQDLKEIKASIVGLHNIKVKGEGLLDLSLLWKSLLNAGLILPYNTSSGGTSLSAVVQSCFGLPLGKSEQCSNWELRPLRDTQIEYAALDSFVLMKIYLHLQNLCYQQGINFDEICNDAMAESKQKMTKKLKTADKLKSSLSMCTNQVKETQEVKFLVDPPLSNLLTYLRYIGIDAEIIKPGMSWHEIVNLAISDNRFILLKKLKFTPMSNYPQSSILELKGDDIKEHLSIIFSHFQIHLTHEKIYETFDRCLNCNAVDLRIMTTEDIFSLNGVSGRKENSELYRFSNYNDTEDYYDNFLSDSDDGDYDILLPIHASTNNVVPNCSTKSGVPIASNEIHQIVTNNKDVIHCGACGNLYNNSEDLVKSISAVFDDMLLLSKS